MCVCVSLLCVYKGHIANELFPIARAYIAYELTRTAIPALHVCVLHPVCACLCFRLFHPAIGLYEYERTHVRVLQPSHASMAVLAWALPRVSPRSSLCLRRLQLVLQLVCICQPLCLQALASGTQPTRSQLSSIADDHARLEAQLNTRSSTATVWWFALWVLLKVCTRVCMCVQCAMHSSTATEPSAMGTHDHGLVPVPCV